MTSPAPARVRVLVVDDNAVVRLGLESLLEASGACTVVGQAADGAEAIRLADELRPDVVLLDVRMPGLDGVSALAALTAVTRVLMMTYSDDDQVVLAALRAGASGYLVHGQLSGAELVSAVVGTAAGSSVLSPPAAAAVLRALAPEAAAELASELSDAPTGTGGWGLTDREAEVLDRAAQGLTNAEIAATCYLAEKTVKNHLNRAFAKLGARTRAQAVSMWLQRSGPLGPDPRSGRRGPGAHDGRVAQT